MSRYDRIVETMLAYDEDQVVNEVKNALQQGLDPKEIFDVMSETMKEIGRRFVVMECFLPEVMIVSDALKTSFEILKPEMAKLNKSIEKAGTIVIGAVASDIHTVGKDMVASSLSIAGFDVVNLGVEVAPSKFLEAARAHNADIIAASASMTTTRPVQRDLMAFLEASGMRSRFKVVVGGGVTTQDWADKIGADGWAQDAVAAVNAALRLVGKDS